MENIVQVQRIQLSELPEFKLLHQNIVEKNYNRIFESYTHNYLYV